MKISCGILTHNGPVTLFNTLSSYKKNGLLDVVEDIFCIIQPSSKSELEVEVCNMFKIPYFLEKENSMMAGGIKRTFEEAKYNYVLFLESDFRCTSTKDMVEGMLKYAVDVLEQGETDVVRLRSLKKPGHPHPYRIISDEEFIKRHPSELYQCTHFIDNPHEVYPDHIKLIQESPRVYKMSSRNCVYTNNPTMTTKKFYSQYILPYVQPGKELEPQIGNDWTNNSDHKIYITSGIFTHVRLDGHEGKQCWCCPIRFGGVSDTAQCGCCRGTIYNPPFFEE